MFYIFPCTSRCFTTYVCYLLKAIKPASAKREKWSTVHKLHNYKTQEDFALFSVHSKPASLFSMNIIKFYGKVFSLSNFLYSHAYYKYKVDGKKKNCYRWNKVKRESLLRFAYVFTNFMLQYLFIRCFFFILALFYHKLSYTSRRRKLLYNIYFNYHIMVCAPRKPYPVNITTNNGL